MNNGEEMKAKVMMKHILSMMEVLDEALEEEQDMMQTSMKPEQESGG